MRCFVARAMAAGRALQCNAEERFEAAVVVAARTFTRTRTRT